MLSILFSVFKYGDILVICELIWQLMLIMCRFGIVVVVWQVGSILLNVMLNLLFFRFVEMYGCVLVLMFGLMCSDMGVILFIEVVMLFRWCSLGIDFMLKYVMLIFSVKCILFVFLFMFENIIFVVGVLVVSMCLSFLVDIMLKFVLSCVNICSMVRFELVFMVYCICVL